ncbi:hypothetical protein Tco_0593333 [Tanacetum coccineum]
MITCCLSAIPKLRPLSWNCQLLDCACANDLIDLLGLTSAFRRSFLGETVKREIEGRTLQLLRRTQQKQVLDLQKAKDAQAKEIADLKKRVQKLERKKKSNTTGLKILKKVGMSRRVESYEIRRVWGRSDNEEMFDINDLHSDEVNVDMPVEITLAQTLIQIKAAKPKVVTTAATTTTTTRPKARGVVVHEPSEFRTPQESQPSMIKDKGKAIMIEPEVPLKRKDQVALDEDLARNLQAQLEAELIEEERLIRTQEKEEAKHSLIESW